MECLPLSVSCKLAIGSLGHELQQQLRAGRAEAK